MESKKEALTETRIDTRQLDFDESGQVSIEIRISADLGETALKNVVGGAMLAAVDNEIEARWPHRIVGTGGRLGGPVDKDGERI